MATRWDVTKAVRTSDLPAPARLVMFVLADVAEVGTAEIPERRTPSLTCLANETGLDRSTVKRHLGVLAELGWVERSRPEPEAAGRQERTRYRLLVPVVGAESTQAQNAPSPGAEDAQSRRTPRLDLGAHRAPTPSITDIQDKEPSSSAKTSPTRRESKPERPDVERICAYLADKIEANGSLRPTITAGWRSAARLMIDKDHRTVDKILKAIDWCQADEFWRANILSMPTLRAKYDQLRLAARRNGNARASPLPASTAPTKIPESELCPVPEHHDQRATTCRHCRAKRIAKEPP